MANLNVNKVVVGGRITHDLEPKVTPQGMSILTFSIAVGRKNDKAKTDFINCKAFGNTANNICKFFKKGSTILVFGNIQISSWQDQNGQKRSTTDVVVDEFTFVDSKNEVANAPDFNSFATPPQAPNFEEITDNSDLPF